MKSLIITEKEAGLRLDKVIMRYLPSASTGFIYKMLRKKNITLNGKRAEGRERVQSQDELKFFLSEETLALMQKTAAAPAVEAVPAKKPPFLVLYEDAHVLIINKPAGMLSQKAKKEDVSLIEHMRAYLCSTGFLSGQTGELFHPAVCNRLDRNTSGIVLAGKTTYGLQELSEALSQRTLEKYYLTIVKGELKKKELLSGYLIKEGTHNRVRVLDHPTEGASLIRTAYEPLATGNDLTLLRIHLITGKSHQIRAHLASIRHPVIGDGKYGDPVLNQSFKRSFRLQNHLLHAYEVRFGKTGEHIRALEGKTIQAKPPEQFLKIMQARFPQFVLS